MAFASIEGVKDIKKAEFDCFGVALTLFKVNHHKILEAIYIGSLDIWYFYTIINIFDTILTSCILE